MTAWHELVAHLAGRRVVVIGDLILDEYLVGRATRLSREAPVPVLEYVHSFTVLGGAANPAHNIVALGGQAAVVGVVGDDDQGHRLLGDLAAAGCDVSGVIIVPGRATTVKTRIVAEGALIFAQHLARIDRSDAHLVGEEAVAALCDHCARLAADADAVLLSDYKLGVITSQVTATARKAARAHGACLTVDSQGRLDAFLGFDLVKCNRGEAEAFLRRSLTTDAEFTGAARHVLTRLNAGALVITRGAEGMTVATRAGEVWRLLAANRSEVFDVTGAGDTVIAVMTLALAAGLGVECAARLANAAAGLVVRRMGNAVVRPDELVAALQSVPAST